MRSIWILAFGALFVHPAFAMVEVRGNYGASLAKPDGFNTQFDHSIKGAPDVEAPKMLGIDALYTSIKGLTAGLRFETGSFKKSGPASLSNTPVTTTVEYKSTRAALLGGVRLVNRPNGYVGALAHYAISQKADFTSSSVNGGGATSKQKYDGEMAASYGLGLEAGAKVNHVVFGAEAGYAVNKVNKFKDTDGVILDPTTLKPWTLDLSGVYLRASVGYAF